MGSREQVKAVVEEVWRRRAAEAEEMGVELGEVRIDWREVVANMGIDLLLY